MANIKYDFKGKSVVITGGAQGIGFEITKQFLSAGAQVSIWDYNEDALKTASAELSRWKDQLHTAQVDVTNRASCQNAAASTPWKIEVLINNAGITRDKSFAKMEGEDWDKVIETNLTGLFNVTKSMFAQFSESSNKRIINMASVVGLYGNFGQTNYAATKSGVIGLTKTWAKELGRKGFTCNAVAPGFILTKMTKAMPEEVLKGMEDKVPVQRLGETSDIANACLFLASDEASYINGTTLSVDGAIVL